MRHHLVGGVEVAFTQAEEDAADVRVAEREASRPTEVWQRNMEATDIELPRSVEDIWDVHGSPNARTQKLLDDKKALRAARP